MPGAPKDKNGLTPQQEMFCQYVVDAYGTTTKGILTAAYRKAFNCDPNAKDETHYKRASELAQRGEIQGRIDQLRKELLRPKTITREQLVTDDVNMLDIDPLDLWIQDEQSGRWRMRTMVEIPKHIRKLLKFVRIGKALVPDIDKDAARKRLIEVLGFDSAKDININNATGFSGLRIGFGNSEK